MKKENKLVKFTMFVLLITIIAIVLVAGTYAKYTSKVSGESTATVAKWSIKVNNNELAAENSTVTFNLFETINDTGNTAQETDVEDGLIAPGTAGSFNLKVKNESEVTAKYSIDFVLKNTSNIPIEFSTDGTTWTNSITALAEKTLAVGAPEDTMTVQWRWAFNGTDSTNYQATQNDVTDTTLGIAAQTAPAKVIVTTTLTATQVD